MTAVNLHSLARMTVSSSGTGTITLNNAVSGFLTFDLAGCSTAAAGTLVRYAINDTTKSEIAYGTYTSSALTLTRGSSTTGMKSTNSDSPIDMSTSAQVFITPSALDFPIVVDSGGTAGTLALNMTFSGTATFSAATTFSAAITYGGVTLSNAVTGTGNMVLSASPTFTGTVTAAALTMSGVLTYGGVALAAAVTGTGNMVLSASPTFTGTITAANIAASGSVVAAAQPGFSANKNLVNQAGIASGTPTLVTFGTELFDTGAYYNTANSRWTPPASKVAISAAVYLSGITSGTATEIAIYKNGALFQHSIVMPNGTTTGAYINIIDAANGTDYYEVYVSGTTSTSITVDGAAYNSYFSGVVI